MAPRFIVRDKPGLWWILSALFALVSSGFVYLAVTERTALAAWQTGLVAVLGLAGLVAAWYIAGEAPLTTITLAEPGDTLLVARRGVRGRQLHTVPITSIRKIVIERRNDDEGYPLMRPALLLTSGETILLSKLWRHGEADTRDIVDKVASCVPRACAPEEPSRTL